MSQMNNYPLNYKTLRFWTEITITTLILTSNFLLLEINKVILKIVKECNWM